ncbi:hypothetical protein BHAOGJBA_1282 [Methylobacterium hispanicum]|uniref:TadE-like domain-containing protein n=1 Tax=Methylobacterium hispanicum TaxID=270350 RepID=A0AAV4ZHV5_9HYPH|nr:TadE/TadG family type IV pilus assembly protein [Methylobacterium hispanicum]GJD87777.1 hypothetical protein BHAOGJBA_1282 [Methylobacterium hispanicum]
MSGLAGRRALRGFCSDRMGATAVEFAFLAFPFFGVLLVVFQAGLSVLTQQSLDAATDRANRVLFTGAFQAGANGVAAKDRLKAVMCAGSSFVDCNELKVEVTASTTFDTRVVNQPYDAAGRRWNPDFGNVFQCPGGDQVVTIQAALPVPMFTSLLSAHARAMPGGKQLLTSTAVFRSEPYSQGRC